MTDTFIHCKYTTVAGVEERALGLGMGRRGGWHPEPNEAKCSTLLAA